MDPATLKHDDLVAAKWLAHAVLGDRRAFEAEIDHLGRTDLREMLYVVARRTLLGANA